MSFTEDELQEFNTILEQRLARHRQEMEQAYDQRLEAVRQGIESQLTLFQQETQSQLSRRLASQMERLEAILATQRESLSQRFQQEMDQKAHQVESTIERLLTAQLSGIEQLLSQQKASAPGEPDVTEAQQQPETMEVQTELSWDELLAVMGKALDERLEALNSSLQQSVKDVEQYLTIRLHSLHDELTRYQGARQPVPGNTVHSGTSLQEILSGIEHLERVMESMQVAMTANHALLSNRLYHHQQLPLERAHPNPAGHTHVAPANGIGPLLSQAKEQLGGRLESDGAYGSEKLDGSMGQ